MTLKDHPNLQILELVASALGPICEHVVFVGGCAVGLLLTQQRPDHIRITQDVDIVTQALSVHDYHAIEQQIRARGFSTDVRPQAPICRWVYQNIAVDLMPSIKEILGFANRWYPLAIETALPIVLPSGTCVRLIAAPVFIATKLEAFKDRGKHAQGHLDFLGSHDLEDILTVVDRRPELLDECAAMSYELRSYLAQELQALFAMPDFETSLAGHLPADAASQQRLGGLKQRLRKFCELKNQG